MRDQLARNAAQALDLLRVVVEQLALRRLAHQLAVLLGRAALHGRGGQQQHPAFLDLDAFLLCRYIECNQQEWEKQRSHSVS